MVGIPPELAALQPMVLLERKTEKAAFLAFICQGDIQPVGLGLERAVTLHFHRLHKVRIHGDDVLVSILTRHPRTYVQTRCDLTMVDGVEQVTVMR